MAQRGEEGFYERGYQVKTLPLLEGSFVFLGIQPRSMTGTVLKARVGARVFAGAGVRGGGGAEPEQAWGAGPCRPWFYRRLEAYSFFRSCEQVARRCAPFSAPPRLFKGKCQSPPEPARMNPDGIGERPQRNAEYARRCAKTAAPFSGLSIPEPGNTRKRARPAPPGSIAGRDQRRWSGADRRSALRRPRRGGLADRLGQPALWPQSL